MTNINDHLANVAQVARGCPTVTLRHAYMRAMRNWCRQTQWLRTNVAASTVANQPQYNIGNDPDLDCIGIYAMQGSMVIPPAAVPSTWPILPSADPGGWNPAFQPTQPLQYSYLAEAAFALFPTPNAVYQLGITILVAPKEAAVNAPASPLVKYSTVFEAGALAYLLGLDRQTWTDKAEAQWQAKLFSAGVSNGKAEVQRQYNTGATRARPRAFLMGGGGGYYP